MYMYTHSLRPDPVFECVKNILLPSNENAKHKVTRNESLPVST